MRKCKRAVTDSEACIAYREEQPGLKNLIDIYCACMGKTPDEAVKEFEGKGYGELKMGCRRSGSQRSETSPGGSCPSGKG